MEKYHIGQEILKEVKAKYPSVAAFARELCKSSSATYEIFGKTSLDTDLLLKVSKLLDRDFFHEFSEKCLNGEVAVVDKQTAENSISLLLPEDKLHTVLPSQTMDVVEEYLLMPRKKPLVVFYYGVRSRNLPRFVCKKGEEIYGEGMVRNIRLDPVELMRFELGVPTCAHIHSRWYGKAFRLSHRTVPSHQRQGIYGQNIRQHRGQRELGRHLERFVRGGKAESHHLRRYCVGRKQR